MGIIKISDQMHDNVRIAGDALNRSINAQAEHWMLLGMLAELHPDMNNAEICRMLVRGQLSPQGPDAVSIQALSGAAKPTKTVKNKTTAATVRPLRKTKEAA